MELWTTENVAFIFLFFPLSYLLFLISATTLTTRFIKHSCSAAQMMQDIHAALGHTDILEQFGSD